MRIGELSRLTGCPIETIRYYEHEGLLPAPARSEGNYRLYSDRHVARLRFIRHCRQLDMTLEEIRVLLRFKDAPQEHRGEVDAVVAEHIAHVEARIDELKALREQLTALRAQCQHADEPHEDCGVLRGLEEGPWPQAEGASPEARPAGHVHGAHGPHQGRKPRP